MNHGKQVIRKGIKTVVLYTCVLLVLCIIGMSWLYLAGLLPQDRIAENYAQSVEQFKEEGYVPFILNRYRADSRLNNYSELLILYYSAYMNTQTMPAAFLTNPANISFEQPYQSMDIYVSNVLNEEEPNYFYTRYWQGFRAVVRPLLSVMDYPEMRRFMLWAFVLLGTGCVLTLRKVSRTNAIPFVFVFSLLVANPIVVSTSFQYGICYFIAFVGMLLVSRTHQSPGITLLFFILGAATQFFNFYTAPAVPLAYSLCMLLICDVYQQKNKPIVSRIGKGTLAYCLAYVGMWIAKLTLTTIFTDINAFPVALNSFFSRVSIVKNEALSEFYSVSKAIADTLQVIGSTTLIITAILFCLLLLRSRIGKPIRDGWRIFYAGLLIAAIPVIVMIIAAQPTAIHSYYQFRGWTATIFAMLTAAILAGKQEVNSVSVGQG